MPQRQEGSEMQKSTIRSPKAILTALAMTAALVLSACGSGSSGADEDGSSAPGGATPPASSDGGSAAEEPAGGGDTSDPLVIARDMDLNSLDPSHAWCDTCMIYISATYETLVTIGSDNETFEPRLAESWEVNDDATQL